MERPKIVSEQSEAELLRKQWESRISYALREMAANLLRIIRGAGRPEEILSQAATFVSLCEEYREVPSSFLTGHVFAEALNLPNEAFDLRQRLLEASDKATLDRWDADGTFEEMYALQAFQQGMLQIVASKLIGQRTQQSAGERELMEGLNEFRSIRNKRKR